MTGSTTFDESFLYQPTFSVRRGQADLNLSSSSKSDYPAAERDGKVSLEEAAALGCRKCAKELETGEKKKSVHSDHCPRKMFGIASTEYDGKKRAASSQSTFTQQPNQPIKATSIITTTDTQQPQKPPNITLQPGADSCSATAPQIGPGWTQHVTRRTTCNKTDRYYVAPDGKKCRGWAEVEKHFSNLGGSQSTSTQQPKQPNKACSFITTTDTHQPQKPPNISLPPGANTCSAPAPEIAPGWTQHITRRATSNKTDRYYVNSEGKKFRGWAEVEKHFSKSVGSGLTTSTEYINLGQSNGRDKARLKENDTAQDWWFDHDASILRGVESFGASAQTMSKIKKKILAPTSDTHSLKEMGGRHKSLMEMITTTTSDGGEESKVEKEWKLGRRGTWLAAGVEQN